MGPGKCRVPRRLGNEAKRVRSAGTEVVLIQRTIQDLDTMGTNLMSTKRRQQVIEVAARTVANQLRQAEVTERLRGLPPGEPVLVRRPAGTTDAAARLQSPRTHALDHSRESKLTLRCSCFASGTRISTQ